MSRSVILPMRLIPPITTSPTSNAIRILETTVTIVYSVPKNVKDRLFALPNTDWYAVLIDVFMEFT